MTLLLAATSNDGVHFEIFSKRGRDQKFFFPRGDAKSDLLVQLRTC